MTTIETTLTTLTSRSLRQMFIEHNQISWEQQQDAEPQQWHYQQQQQQQQD